MSQYKQTYEDFKDSDLLYSKFVSLIRSNVMPEATDMDLIVSVFQCVSRYNILPLNRYPNEVELKLLSYQPFLRVVSRSFKFFLDFFQNNSDTKIRNFVLEQISNLEKNGFSHDLHSILDYLSLDEIANFNLHFSVSFYYKHIYSTLLKRFSSSAFKYQDYLKNLFIFFLKEKDFFLVPKIVPLIFDESFLISTFESFFKSTNNRTYHAFLLLCPSLPDAKKTKALKSLSYSSCFFLPNVSLSEDNYSALTPRQLFSFLKRFFNHIRWNEPSASFDLPISYQNAKSKFFGLFCKDNDISKEAAYLLNELAIYQNKTKRGFSFSDLVRDLDVSTKVKTLLFYVNSKPEFKPYISDIKTLLDFLTADIDSECVAQQYVEKLVNILKLPDIDSLMKIIRR